jgi:Tol biopolymer transport system component
MKRTAILGLIATLALAAWLTADDKKASVLLQAAQAKETIQGDLKGAIELYKNAVKEAGASRTLAATALIRMAECYQKLGDTESHKIYEQVVRDYGDQKDAVTTARARLAVLSGGQAYAGIVAEQVGPKVGDRRYAAAISSDGRYIGIEEHGQILVQDLHTLEAHVVIGVFNSSKEKFEDPYISPDGKQLACLRVLPEGLPDLYVLGADGSNPRVVAKGVAGLWGWSPDGKRLAVAISGDDGRQGMLLSVTDGSRQLIPGLRLTSALARLSRDGRYIAFFKSGTAGAPPGIYTLPIEGGTPALLAENAVSYRLPAWTPDGKQVLFVRDRQGKSMDLWSMPVANGAPAGPARLLKDNIGYVLDVTAAGDIYYQLGTQTRDLYVAGINAQATRLTPQPRQLTSGEFVGGAAWSPDGQHLAYYAWSAPNGAFTVVIRSATTGNVRNLIPKYPLNERWDGPLSLQPVWSADSRSLFMHGWDGKMGRLDIETGEVKPLWEDNSILPVYRDGDPNPNYRQTLAVSPDGRTIYQLERDQAAQQTKVTRVDLQTRTKSEIYRMDADLVRGFVLSRDGSYLSMARLRAVAGAPPPGGVGSIIVLPTTGGEATELAVPVDAREGPSWSSDGRRLFLASKNPVGIYSMPVEGGPPQLMGRGVDLNELHFLNASPDGTQIVFTDEHWNNHLWVLKNALNKTTTAR